MRTTQSIAVGSIVALALCGCGAQSNATAPTPVPVSASSFVGLWKNVNPDTDSIPQLQVRLDGDTIYVHGYGACYPTFCDWGEAAAGRSEANAGTFTVNWDAGFATTRLTLSLPSASGRLLATMLRHYTDNSGRPDAVVLETFEKSS